MIRAFVSYLRDDFIMMTEVYRLIHCEKKGQRGENTIFLSHFEIFELNCLTKQFVYYFVTII